MKINRMFTTIAGIIVIMTAVMIGCKKESEPAQSDNKQPEMNNSQNDAVIQRILKFKGIVDAHASNPGLKNTETMTIDEAMNNVVDLFNVTYTEPMAYYTITEEHKFSINLPITPDGKVLVDDVATTYEKVVAEAKEVYHGSSLSNKGYRRLMVTCEMQRNGEVCLDFNGQYGTRGTTPPTPPIHYDGPFRTGDDWYYKDGMGSCDGTRPGGADKILQDTIMAEVRSLWPADPNNNSRGFYTNFVTYTFYGPNYTGIFYTTDEDSLCIEWQYMNDYLHGERRNIFQEVPTQIGISLQNNLIQQYQYFVTNVVIDGIESGINNHEEDVPVFFRHDTEVEYGRYSYIDNGIIERQQL